MTQKEAILKHLKRGRKITPLDALNMYGCFRLSAVIHALKKSLLDGETIITEVARKGNKNFAKYSLKKQPK